MCGIAGLIELAQQESIQSTLKAMAATIVHRGPDDEGFYVASTRDGDHAVGLAHRRLSIIDLSTGHQPIGNEDSSVQLVFNGEIYNYKPIRRMLIDLGHDFRTLSDSETIVHAYEEWGDSCVERFRGMFAFALWDARKDRLLLARDPFGKKPLYLYEGGERLVFGSEIKAILAAPGVAATVDLQSVVEYFAHRYVPGPATLFENIRKLGPGSIAVWEKGQLREQRYWFPPDRQPWAATESLDDVPSAFREKLDECVQIRLASDVPFGAFMSGGIDSSAVVALMSRHLGEPVKTFAVGFSEAEYSELDYANRVAQHFKTDHHELMISHTELMEHLPTLVRYRDAPVSEPADIPIYLLSREARRSVKMILTGEGSDELLGGYPKHLMERFTPTYQTLPGVVRRDLIEPLVGALPFKFRRIKTAISTMALESEELRMVRWFGALSPDEIADLLKVRPSSQRKTSEVPFDVGTSVSALRRILYFDQTSWLPDNLLERGDRMTMAASIEARMPFMDRELADFVSRLPDRWRIHGRVRKYVLRKAMEEILPPEILNRPKVGFRVPVDKWFQGHMRNYLYDHLMGSDCRTRDLYRAEALRRIVTEHVEGHRNHEKILWAMLNLEIWYRQYQ
jgi:asparagine synthase (glutamine-hydrolysing)